MHSLLKTCIAVAALTPSIALAPEASAAVGLHATHEYVFVANADFPAGTNSSVSVVDPLTGRTVRTTTQGLGPGSNAIALSPDHSKIYVANFGAAALAHDTQPQTVSVLDVSSGVVRRTLDVGKQPVALAVSTVRHRAYVVNSGTVQDPGGVTVIDTDTDEVERTIVEGVANPAGITLSPDQHRAYVTNESTGTVVILDTDTDKVVGQVTLGITDGYPTGIAASPDGRYVYVANNAAGTISVIDTVSASVSGVPLRVPGFGMPQGVAVTPDGRKLYVTEGGSDEVAVVDLVHGVAQPNTIRVGRNPVGVTIDPAGKKAYVVSASDDHAGLSVLDTATDTVTATLNVGSSPFGVTTGDIAGELG